MVLEKVKEQIRVVEVVNQQKLLEKEEIENS